MDSKVSKAIDVKGKICPYPLIDTRDALKGINKGEVLEVITDHKPAATETIPSFCNKKGYPYKIIEEGNIWRVLIEKND